VAGYTGVAALMLSRGAGFIRVWECATAFMKCTGRQAVTRVKQFIVAALNMVGVIALVLIVYLLAWPVEIDPAAWTPPPAPSPTGVFAPNDRLTHLEKLAKGHIGPESVAIDEKGVPVYRPVQWTDSTNWAR
jgi:hypothetical protein